MLTECLRAKERLWPEPPQFLDSLAEGIKTQQCGHLTFPILCELAESEVWPRGANPVKIWVHEKW